MPDSITLAQLNRATLARQMLLGRAAATLAEATEHLVGIQAQLARPPFIGLWSRVDDMQRDTLVGDLLRKRLVRGTSLRGTLHVMTAADFVRFRATIQPALDRGVRMVRGRIDARDIDELLTVAKTYFREPHTFDAMRDHLAERFPRGDVRALAYTVRMLLPLLQVPTETEWGFPAQAEFVTAESWLGALPQTGEGVEQLILRYLAAYGPGTLADIQAWSGLSSLGPVLKTMRPQLVTFRSLGNGELFDVPDAPRPDAGVPAPIRFLPDYDNVIIGRADARLLAAEHRELVFLPGLRVAPTVLVDGLVAGTWKAERRGKSAALLVSPFETMRRAVKKEVEVEAEALIRFVEPHATGYRVQIG